MGEGGSGDSREAGFSTSILNCSGILRYLVREDK